MKKNKNKKNHKKGIIVLCVVLAILVALFVAGFAYWKSITSAPPEIEDTLTYDFDDKENEPTSLQDDPVFEDMFEGDSKELKESIKNWAKNGGEIMYSEDVINVLCVGVDTRNKNTISGLTDSMIIASVNKKLGTITFTSVMRDCYAYLESPDGVGSFNKINSAFPFYGVNNLINTLESHFKIKIDGYAMINFSFFKAVIDKLGGVTVPVQQYEANYINKHYNFGLESGSAVTLNGDEALAFCRSRHCDADGDISRTRRQRQVIIGLLQKAATIKTSEVPEYVATFMPYLKTNYSESEIISLATKAVVGGWARFEVQQYLLPDEESRTAHNGSTWYWEVDYPLAAQKLQKLIYGKTNIVLKDDRGEPKTTNTTEKVTTTESQKTTE